MIRKPKKVKKSYKKAVNTQYLVSSTNPFDTVEMGASSLPRFFMMSYQGYFMLSLNARIPIKKLIITFSAIGTVILAIAKLLNTDWDTLYAIFLKSLAFVHRIDD